MINIEEIERQIESLKRCVDNHNSAKEQCDIYLLSPYSTDKEIDDSKKLMERCEKTLIGQLKLMSIQNEKSLKS